MKKEIITFDSKKKSAFLNPADIYKIAKENKILILSKVAHFYGINRNQLRLKIEESFMSRDCNHKCFFYVYDKEDNCYGVAADIYKNKTVKDLRCGKLDKFS